MSEIILQNIEKATIKQVFDRACKVNSKNELICSALKHPTDNKNCYTFEKVKNLSRLNSLHLLEKGLMIGDRVSIIIGNIPEFFIIKLALNCIGVSCVPINAELSANEISYLIRHSNSRLIITNKKYFNYLKKIEIIIKKKIGLALYSNNFLEFLINIKNKKKIKLKKKIVSSTEASLLYTSGTTGKPKGCILSHAYEINAGINYINKSGYISIKKNKERIYNCLPVHHVNSGILSFYAAILSGNCQIQSSKFSANSFWKEIKYSKATIFHYLGVMVSILIKKKHTKYERDNNLRLGVGAGIPPNLHKNFETRFKVPMIELWGMTEMVRCIFDNNKDREVGSRCIGKPKDIIETKVIDTNGKEIINQPGQLLIRYSKKNPKKYYLNNVLATKNLVNTMIKNKINNFVFSSSASVYGKPSSNKISETHNMKPISEYGKNKKEIEKFLYKLGKKKNFKSLSFRYFNAAGCDNNKRTGEDHKPEMRLIPVILQECLRVINGGDPQNTSLKVFGNDYNTEDGSCIRDYIHVNDLCSAHLTGVKRLYKSSSCFEAYNLSSGQGYSVFEVIDMCKKITGADIKYEIKSRREGDPPNLVGDPKKANSILKWQTHDSSLETIVKTAWEWILSNEK